MISGSRKRLCPLARAQSEAFSTNGQQSFDSFPTVVPAAQKAYFFLAAFFLVAFFFVAFLLAAFFLVAIMDLHVGLIRGASIYMVDGNASKGYARGRVLQLD